METVALEVAKRAKCNVGKGVIMLSETLVEHLNQQINLEFYSSNMYLQMSSWCEFKGLEGCAQFMKLHAQEEMGHMHRLFNYVNETGAMALLGKIKSPPTEFKDIKDVFEKTYAHEQTVTKRINELADVAMKDKDYSTFNFLQWYVAEQHEEEKLFKSILDKIEMVGIDDKGLFFFDQEMKGMATQKAAAGVDATGEGP
jgi:ferritin